MRKETVSMLRFTLAAVALALSATVPGCGPGYSTDEAQNRCLIESEAKLDCFDATSTSECLSCFEKCGDSCNALPTCPSTYQCP
jgi:hypothetical protein